MRERRGKAGDRERERERVKVNEKHQLPYVCVATCKDDDGW